VSYQEEGVDTISGLANGIEYCVGMTAEDSFDNSSDVSVPGEGSVVPFAFPDNFSRGNANNYVEGGEIRSRIGLSWQYTDGLGEGVDHVSIVYGTSSESYFENIEFTPDDSPIIIDNLDPETRYYFNIRTINEAGYESDLGGEIDVGMPPYFAFPHNLTVSDIGTSDLELNWEYTDGSGEGVDGVEVLQGVASEDYTASHSIDGSPTSTNITDLDPGTQYYFNVRTHRSGYESELAGEASAETLP